MAINILRKKTYGSRRTQILFSAKHIDFLLLLGQKIGQGVGLG